MFCPNCGAKNEEGTNFCSSCGGNMNQTVKPTTVKEKNGKSIASMVLGIIAVVWTLFVLLGLSSLSTSLIESINESNPENIFMFKFGFFIGYNFLSFPCGIIGLILGLVAKKNGKAIAGIVMSSIAVFVSLISLAIIIATTV